MKPDRCQSLAANGKPCAAKVVDGCHCAWHSTAPEWVEKRRQWSAKGGTNRSNAARARKHLPADPMSAAELHCYLGLVFKRVITGKTEPAIASAAATVARTMSELAKASDLEARMAEIERKLGSKVS
jgi:hypothetical protein